jgi:2',3'-cyclic-nucleotide 2'-phosphodiesterase
MILLYIGDIMGSPGRETVRELLPRIRSEQNVDLVIAQSENVSHGVGMTPHHMADLSSYGVDVFTGGNHTYKKSGIHGFLNDDSSPVIGPANLPINPGKGYVYVPTPKGDVLVVSILGTIFPLKEHEETTNPLLKIDEILLSQKGKSRVATIVDFHADWSSEKVVFGHYLDGRVTAVVGDHWHVPSADARVLPGGTAHISDVGMTGALNSCLGVKSELIITRWRDGVHNKNELEENRPWQLNAVIIDSDDQTGLARSIKHLHYELD